MKIFLIILIMFFAPFFAAVAIVDEIIYIDAPRFLSMLNKAKIENEAIIEDAAKKQEYDRYIFYIGKDVAYADVMEYLRYD